jgi:hypothetical protein
VVIVTTDDPEDAQWRAGAYECFMRDDAPEDAVYDAACGTFVAAVYGDCRAWPFYPLNLLMDAIKIFRGAVF